MKNLLLLLCLTLFPDSIYAQSKSSIDSIKVPFTCRRALSRLLPAGVDSIRWWYWGKNDKTKEYSADFKQSNISLFAEFQADGSVYKYYKLVDLEAVQPVVRRVIDKRAKKVHKKHPHSILLVFEYRESDLKRFTVEFYESEEARKADKPSFDSFQIYDDGTIRKSIYFR